MSETNALDWPAQFEKTHGRKPRILHVGNIANYAYVNAKIQRRNGIDAYVLDPDFYHIMASPEWIEVEVEGDHGDDFFPDWSKTSASDYKRPAWFIQGPFRLSVEYMEAHVKGQTSKAKRLRRIIDMFRRTNTASTTVQEGESSKPALRARLIRRLGQKWYSIKDRLFSKTKVSSKAIPASETELPETAQIYRDSYWMYRSLYENFDVIQGYTISAASALAVDMPNVLAYELGTIRGLPFEDSPMGHLTKWVYQTAPAVIVTNVDCIDAANRLGIPEEKRALALHAYDADRAASYSETPEPSPYTGDTPYFFAPARHHWKEGGLSWLKGNDVLIRAAGRLKAAGYDFRIVFVRWGQEVELSEELIRENDLVDNVIWIAPQSTLKLWRVYCGAVAVVDQFKAQAFGGVALDTMALGRRLITAYNEEMGSHFFRSTPPIYNSKTEEDAAQAMQRVLDDPDDNAGDGKLLQEWFNSEHGIGRQLEPQFEIYERLTGMKK